MYVISPWSSGGWVNSQVFDHTSVGQFLEKRFGVTVPGISPWHRAVCGDLLTAFDFAARKNAAAPRLPDARGSTTLVAQALQRPKPVPPQLPQTLVPERGSRPSRALPYVLHVDAALGEGAVTLTFRNSGNIGAVFQVYDKRHLDRIPRRYTVEAGRALTDSWATEDRYDLWVLGPNGFLRGFEGSSADDVTVGLTYHPEARKVSLALRGAGTGRVLSLTSQAYPPETSRRVTLEANASKSVAWDVSRSGNWYDMVIASDGGFVRRFAGRMETGRHSVSDPAMGAG